MFDERIILLVSSYRLLCNSYVQLKIQWSSMQRKYLGGNVSKAFIMNGGVNGRSMYYGKCDEIWSAQADPASISVVTRLAQENDMASNKHHEIFFMIFLDDLMSVYYKDILFVDIKRKVLFPWSNVMPNYQTFTILYLIRTYFKIPF